MIHVPGMDWDGCCLEKLEWEQVHVTLEGCSERRQEQLESCARLCYIPVRIRRIRHQAEEVQSCRRRIQTIRTSALEDRWALVHVRATRESARLRFYDAVCLPSRWFEWVWSG